MPSFLDLPYEIRTQIYTHLLILPSTDLALNPSLLHQILNGEPLLHPAILSTCHQIHHEALPFLYAKNTFQCHPTLLTSFPRLREVDPKAVRPLPIPPGKGAPKQLTETSCRGVGLIRKWALHARLDCGPFWDGETVARAFTGAKELELEVWQSQFRGAPGTGDDGHEPTPNEVLKRFEGVRGVGTVGIWGSTSGIEGYVAWLEGVMKSPIGSAVGRYREVSVEEV